MFAAIAPVAALLLSVAILVMGNGLQGTLLPVRANLEVFSAFDIGILGSSYFLGFAAGCIYGSRFVRVAGHIRVFTAMASIASAVALAHALLVHPVAWWPLRAITGFCFAVLYIVIESWLNERSTNETRGLVLSVYTIINLTVLTIGQLMITLYDPAAFPLFALASILVSLAAVPVALSSAAAPAPVGQVKIRIRHLYSISPVGFVGCLAVGTVNGSFWSLAPVFAQKSDMDVTGTAFFMSATVIAGALGQWPLGRFSDKIDRRRVISIACLSAALAALTLTLVNDVWDRGLLIFSVAYGFFAFPLYALCVAHANDFVAQDAFVEASSGLLLVYGVGAVIGPLIASALMEAMGADGLFTFTAAIHTATAFFAILRMRRRARPPAETRSDFVTVPETAPTLFALDLRGEEGGGEDAPPAAEPQTTGQD